MTTKIFVMTHKLFEQPPNTMYVPMHVGHALGGTLHEDYLRDDDGEDNISVLNPCAINPKMQRRNKAKNGQ